MATEKGIVNVSQSVVSLSSGRLAPGQIMRVRDHYREQDGYMQDVILKQFLTAGYLSVQDIDFDALAQAKMAVAQAQYVQAAEQAKAAVEQATQREMEVQAAEMIVQEKRAEPLPEPPSAHVVPIDEPAEDIQALYEKQRKERIARALEERGAAQSVPAPEPASEAPGPGMGRRRVRK